MLDSRFGRDPNFGYCDFPGCPKKFDFRKFDKPPPGWAHVMIQRWSKSAAKSASRMVCPEHTMDFATRTGLLPQRTAWKRVIIESPYDGSEASQIEENLRYVRAVMRACLLNGEAPFASHALYTQPGVLNSKNFEERRIASSAGLEWGEAADKTVVYTDRGTTDDMRVGIAKAHEQKRPVDIRKLKGWKGT